MTKKHFIKIICSIIASNKAVNFSNPLSQIDLINKLSDYFKSVNENFDQEKFSSAC